MRYRARAPLRIDFGGGFTDVPLYAEREGGAVLNAAITRYARGSLDEGTDQTLLGRLHGRHGSLEYALDVPSGAGLGASAAQTVLWVALTRAAIANTAERREIAEIAWRIAGLLGILGGKQDEYASALGGIAYYTFSDIVTVQRLTLDGDFLQAFRSRLVLVYAGKRRVSGDLHDLVWERYAAGDPATVAALAALKRIAGEMRDALLAGDLDAFGALLSENWANQRALHPSISTPLLDEVYAEALRHGAIGGKACGAGGGGCMLFLAHAGEAERLGTALRQRGLEQIDFDFDTYGVYVSKG